MRLGPLWWVLVVSYNASMGTAITRACVERTAIIPNGQSESNPIDVDGGVIITLISPSTWTSADLSFLGSVDGSNFFPVYDDEGVEVKIAQAAIPSERRMYVNSQKLEKLAATKFIKLRSGVNGAPVNQGGTRSWTVGIKG